MSLPALSLPEAVSRPRGRPRLSPSSGTVEVTLRMPESLFDLCCREAHARDVPLSVVIREAIIASRRRRGERV